MNKKQTLIYTTICILNTIAEVAKIDWLNYITKPLITISLICFYLQHRKSNIQFVDKVMVFALLFSCFGDTILMFEDKGIYYFIFGLGSFLLAHVCYVFIFSRNIKFEILKTVPFIVCCGLAQYLIISPISELPLKIAVFAYISVITLMTFMAFIRKTIPKSYLTVFIGAIIFTVSDFCIGFNKFVNPIPNAGFWIMITYVIAQYLIVKGFLFGRIAADDSKSN